MSVLMHDLIVQKHSVKKIFLQCYIIYQGLCIYLIYPFVSLCIIFGIWKTFDSEVLLIVYKQTLFWSYSCLFIDEKVLMNTLPKNLRTDLAIHVHFNTLSKVKLFQDCDKTLLFDLVLKLKPILYLPGDYVCRKVLQNICVNFWRCEH